MKFVLPDHATADRWHEKTTLFRGHWLKLLSLSTIADNNNYDTAYGQTACDHALKFSVWVMTNLAQVITVEQILAAATTSELVSLVRKK